MPTLVWQNGIKQPWPEVRIFKVVLQCCLSLARCSSGLNVVFEQRKFNCASITVSVRPLNRQTVVDNKCSMVHVQLQHGQISWVCSLSNPRTLIRLFIRLRSREINDQAPSLTKIHRRGWSLGTRLRHSGLSSKLTN